MSLMRNKRLARALEQFGLLRFWAEAEARRRHEIAEAARALIPKPMTADERRRHHEEVAAVRRADEAKRQ